MRICPDCGEPLTKVSNVDRLYRCEISGLYYPVDRMGRLGEPLISPPGDIKQKESAQELTPRPTKQTTLPPRLREELASNIGEDQIQNFIQFLNSELNMKPFEFMMQPNRLKQDVMSRAFPHWLEARDLL